MAGAPLRPARAPLPRSAELRRRAARRGADRPDRPLPARARRRPGRYGELRRRSTRSRGCWRGPRPRPRQPGAAARAEQPVARRLLVRRAQGRRGRGHHDADAAPGSSCARSPRSPGRRLALCDDRFVDELARADCPTAPVVTYGDGDLHGRAAPAPRTVPARSTPPPTTSRCSPSPPAPPAGRRRRCTSTATCWRSPTPSPRTCCGRPPDDVFTGTPPLAFTFGLGGLVVFPLRVGASTLLLERATPDELADAIAEHGVTVLFTAPTAYRAMLAAGKADGCAGLRRCVSAGEHLPARGLGGLPRRHRASGSSTASARPRCCTSSSPPPTTTSGPGSTGRPVPGYRAAVLDEDGDPVPDGQPGPARGQGPDRLPLPGRRRASGSTCRTAGTSPATPTARRRRLLLVPGPQRRHDHLLRLQHRRARGRGGAARPPRRAGVRRRRRRRTTDRGQRRHGLRRAA